MNLKKLVLQLGALVVFVLLAFGATNAQTFYVNNQSGNDANPGTAALPKLTVASAIIAAPPGATIQVAPTGIDYTEGNIVINKALTFTSVGGTPVFANASLDVQVATAFTGPFQFQNLTLTAGLVTGASNLTVAGNVVRTAGSVSGQLNFTAGAHNFTYDGLAAVTSGGELPAGGDATHFGNLTTTGAGTVLTLNEGKTVNGLITTSDVLKLGGNTLTIKGANAHLVAGDVQNGTLAFQLSGAASVDATVAGIDLPNITVTASAAQTLTIDPAGLQTIADLGNVTVSNKAAFTANNTGVIGNVENSGDQAVALNNGGAIGNITLSGAGTIATNNNGNVGNVLLSGSGATLSVTNNGTAGSVTANAGTVGTITLARLAAGKYTTSNIMQSGAGLITYGANVNEVAVNGYVTLNSALSLPAGANAAPAAYATKGLITFPNVITTVSGAVTNSASINLNNNNQGAGNTTLGVITFQAADVDVTLGSVTNSTTSSGAFATVNAIGPGTLADFGNIVFSYTGATAGNNFTVGNVTNSSSVVRSAGFTNAGNIVFGAVTNAAGLITIADLSNTSTTGTAQADFGLISFGLTGAAPINVASVSTSGAAGGDIQFGIGNVAVTGNISSTRSAAGADILWGAGTAAVTVTAANIINSGAANIDVTVTTTGAVNLTGKVEMTGAGKIRFANATTATFGFDGLTLTNGELVFAGNGTITIGDSQPVSMTAGTFTSGGNLVARNLDITASDVTIGGAITNPTFSGCALTTIRFDEPVPNVIQVVKIGGANPVYPGPLSVINNANIPAPVVKFQPASGAVANLYVLNNVTFNTGLVLNSVQLDAVRLNVGKNGIGGGNGNFQNTTGYVTVNGGYVMMSGTNAQQTVNAVASALGATFGAFGVDNERAGLTDVQFLTPVTLTTDFYLAEGDVDNANITFKGTAPWPTIYRTEGTFDGYPAIFAGTKVNVTYYGSDKATSWEIPAGAGELNDLTVATTNGVKPGKGVVALNGAVTVNGVLTINADQALYTAANTLTIAGTSVVNNGYLVDDGAIRVQLAAATGTAITGPGKFPSLQINAGSAGNTISNVPGVISAGFGADGVWDGAAANADDFATTDGSISFAGGAASSVTATFSGAGPHFNNLTMAAGGTFTLGANAKMAGDLRVPAGLVALGDYTLDVQGLTPAITGGAAGGAITSSAAGKLLFQTGSPVLTVTAPAATIAANLEYSADGGVFTLDPAGANLTVTGKLTLTNKSDVAGAATFAIGAGRTLTAAGTDVTVGTGCAFTAPGAGTGILLLDVAAPNTLLTYSTPSNTTVANLTVADNVALTSGGTLQVTGAFIHNGGDINIGATNLKINGTYTRTTGTYNPASTGYLIYNGAGWNHGTALTINNLQVDAVLNIVLATPTTVTVVKNLVLNGVVLTQAATGTSYLTIGAVDGVATVDVHGAGNINNAAGQAAPTFLGTTNYLFEGTSSVPNTFTWPANQANNVTLDMDDNTQTVTVGANRTINGNIDLTLGDLVWDSPVTVTLADGKKITRRDNGSVLNNNVVAAAPSGTFTATNVNLAYQNVAAPVDVITTDLEYTAPAHVMNVELLAVPVTTPATPATTVTIDDARTVEGVLTMASVLNINANTTFALAQTIPAGSTVNVAGTRTATWSAGLTVNGTYNNAGTTASTGGFAGTGAVNNTGVMNLDGYTVTGAVALGNASVMNLTGNASFGAMTVPAAGANAVINSGKNIAFTGTVTNALLTINTTGNDVQGITLAGNTTIDQLNLTKGADVVVNLSGANLTINTNLGLTRGILNVVDPAVVNLALATNPAGIITAVGYTRTPAQASHITHVTGKLGVRIPVASIGRTEWPVGTTSGEYRPASITFTTGNATITNTTIVVEHIDGTPTGDINLNTLALDKAPYSWRVMATTSLGVSQLFDLELMGTNLNKPFENVSDLKIIRRFDGDATVNGWSLQGGNYSNILQANVPTVGDTNVTVRTQNTSGGIVPQAVFFTIGVPVEVPTSFAVTGTVTYSNSVNTPLENVTVTLNPGGLTATTNAAGQFNFPTVANGTYTVSASTAAAYPQSALSALDAMLVAKNFAGLAAEGLPLAGLKLDAANVNAAGVANNTDALLILTKYGTPATVFAKGDWLFSTGSVTVNGANAVHNLKGIAVGDVNGSWVPGLAKASAALTSDGIQKVNLKDAFEVPVKVTGDVNVAAMSFKFNYPADLVQFESVSSKLSNIKVTNVNGVISVAWADLSGKEAFDVKDNGALVTLKFKPTENFKAGSKVDVSMEAGEIANKDGKVLNAMLKIAQVEGYVPAEFALKQNYPNPFNPTTTVVYDLPVDAKVNLVIFNSLGEEVATLVNNVQTAGSYKVEWNAKNMTSGIYFYRINVEAGERSFVQTNKMILMK